MVLVKRIFFSIIFVISFLKIYAEQKIITPEFLIATVATDPYNDGLKRLKESANEFGYKLEVFGLSETWEGGDMRVSQGGAQKIHLLRDGIKKYAKRDNLLILFVDAYDVVLNAESEVIIKKYFKHYKEYRVLFGAEVFCWPDENLVEKYPLVVCGSRYLNSGMFMGYASEIYQILELGKDLKNSDDDQLFYTNIYLDEKKRNNFKIGLDSQSIIFLNLNGMKSDVSMIFNKETGYAEVYNSLCHTHPVVIHGNGPSKLFLNALANYIPYRHNENHGCMYCNKLEEEDKSVDDLSVAMAIYIDKSIPYLEEFFEYIADIEYDKNNIHLLIFCNQPNSYKTINIFLSNHGMKYASKEKHLKENFNLYAARDYALTWASSKTIDYLLMIDGEAHITNKETLKILLKIAKKSDSGILTPMLTQKGKLFSNFWGALSDDGFYKRSDDYTYITNQEFVGVWNVPFVNVMILIGREKLDQKSFLTAFSYNNKLDPDMSFASFCRNNGHFMFVDNQNEYGYLVFIDESIQSQKNLINVELYDFPNNKELWEKRYIHEKYFELFKPNAHIDQPCPDVYDFPFVSERFCKEIIEVMENFGRWSDGSNKDERLTGGYENVPTRDIHMKQVGLEKQWLGVLDTYVAPVQEKVFIGYYHRPVEAYMMFVARYNPNEQSSLRPHHDASTYSIDVALNRRGIDYEGGGVRYLRYNCTVKADHIGYSMLFPGRLTHYHEGLRTTKGTRYILVSFINP